MSYHQFNLTQQQTVSYPQQQFVQSGVGQQSAVYNRVATTPKELPKILQPQNQQQPVVGGNSGTTTTPKTLTESLKPPPLRQDGMPLLYNEPKFENVKHGLEILESHAKDLQPGAAIKLTINKEDIFIKKGRGVNGEEQIHLKMGKNAPYALISEKNLNLTTSNERRCLVARFAKAIDDYGEAELIKAGKKAEKAELRSTSRLGRLFTHSKNSDTTSSESKLGFLNVFGTMIRNTLHPKER